MGAMCYFIYGDSISRVLDVEHSRLIQSCLLHNDVGEKDVLFRQEARASSDDAG